MSGQVGRPRTFDLALVPIALERRARTGQSWPEIARDLGTNPGTLRNRCAEYVRFAHRIGTAPVLASGWSPGGSNRCYPPPSSFVHDSYAVHEGSQASEEPGSCLRSRCLSRSTTETVQSGVGSAEVRALALKFW